MLDPKILDDFTRKLANGLPGGLASLQDDARKNLHSALEAALAKMDLVSREEFDIQTAVLHRTREKLEQLEKIVGELEARENTEQTPET